MKTAYLTGATGCIGRNLVDELQKDGWNIIVLHRKSSDLSKLDGCNVSFQEVDITDIDSVRKALEKPADVLFHLAANLSTYWGDADIQWKENVLATRNLTTVAMERGIGRFIFTSTGATLESQWMDENVAQKINVGYIRTKRLAELEVHSAIKKGLDAVIIQPIIVIGPYDYNHYKRIFDMMKVEGPRFVLPGNIAFCHAVDVARAHISTFEKGRKGENYVLGGEFTSWLNCSQKICKAYGTTPPKRPLSLWFLKGIAWGMHILSLVSKFKPDITPQLVNLLHDACDVPYYHQEKARADIGYHSRSLDEMIKDYIAWDNQEIEKTKTSPK